MRIGITGSTGFIGTYLTKYLSDKNHSILAFIRSKEQSMTFNKHNIENFIGDLNSPNDCQNFVNKIDIIIHLAHSSTPLSETKDIAKELSLNTNPSLNLLEAIKKSGQKKHLIYSSSGGTIYGKAEEGESFTEESPCNPLSAYGIQKNTIEDYIKMYDKLGCLTYSILRISNPYGVLLPTDRKQGLIGVVLNRILNKKTVQIYGDINNVRDYVHLNDMCKAFELAITEKKSNTYNIGSSTGYSVNKIINMIEEHLEIKSEKEFINNEETKNLCKSIVLDISKAKKELDWTPQIKIEEGLKQLCQEVKSLM